MITKEERRPNNISRVATRALLFNHFLQKGINSEKELKFYIREFLKFTIPSKAVCSHHVAPWQALSDIFFERKHSTFLFGSRSSGKTRMLSLLNNCESTFKPKIQICNAGAIISQAQKNYEYTLSYYEDDLLASTLKNSIQSHTELNNGSVISVITGGLRGFNGQHPAKLRLDEIELIDWYCIAGDSLIDVVRNRSAYPNGVAIKDLVGKPGQYVYCFDVETKKFHLRKIRKVKKTGFKKVLKISYWWTSGRKVKVRKEGFVKVTPDHKMMMFNGEYREAGLLKINDRLKAFAQINVDPDRHPRINVSPTRSNVVEHQFIWEEINGPVPSGYVIHHKDYNKWNSELSNLELMTYSEHLYEHHHGVKRSELTRDRIRLSAKHRGSGWKEKLRKSRLNHWKTQTVNRPWVSKKAFQEAIKRFDFLLDLANEWGCSLETLRVWSRKHGIPYRDPLEVARASAAKRVLGKPYTDKKALETLYVGHSMSIKDMAQYYGVHWDTIQNWMKKHGIKRRPSVSSPDYVPEENHRIFKIEECEPEDVYSMEVEEHHNFVVNGVVAKNCIQEAFSMTQGTGEWEAQDTLSSTRKFSFGSVQRLLSEAKERDLTVYPWCLAGWMKVRTPSGDYRIRDLVGKEFYVYSYHPTKKGLVLRKAKNVHKSQKSARVVRVAYVWWSGRGGWKTGEMICTGDHRILLRDGSYTEAEKLIPGSSLMPFYKKNETIKDFDKYCEVGFTESQPSHKVISVEFYGHEDVYDLEVEETHNFACEDIFVHNCIWETLEKCTRECFNDPVYGDCPVYSKKNLKTGKDDIICGGKAHNCSGFYPISGFIKKVKLLDRNTWKAQWLCEKVGDSSTVYGEFFSEEANVLCTEQEFMKKFHELEGEPMTARHRRVSGIDFGGQFAFVRLVKSPSNRRRFYVLEVYFNRNDVTLDVHIEKIKKMMWWGRGKETIFGDPAARQDIIEFNNKGIPVHLAVKEVFNGINLIKSLLETQDDGNPGIYINGPRCEAIITEFGSYSYKIRKDGLPDLDSIFKERDHCLDALRYALYTTMKSGSSVRTGRRRNF